MIWKIIPPLIHMLFFREAWFGLPFFSWDVIFHKFLFIRDFTSRDNFYVNALAVLIHGFVIWWNHHITNLYIERFSYDLKKWFRWEFVICFICQWTKRSKHGLKPRSPKTTAKLIQNNLLFFHNNFSAGHTSHTSLLQVYRC